MEKLEVLEILKLLKDKKTLTVFFSILACIVMLVIIIVVIINNKTVEASSLNTDDYMIVGDAQFEEDNNRQLIVVDLSIDDNNIYKKTGDSDYYIKVNKSQNVVNIYKKDDEGYYTIPIKAMLCSTGPYTPSCERYPSNTYQTTGYKKRWNYLQGNVYGQYATHIVGNILFHSVPYEKQDLATLEYEEFDKLGTSASAGCVRLTVEDAKWIYDNIEEDTIVEFYSDINPGPLGKPTVMKISENTLYRNWDPTDPDSNNPWKDVLN